MGGDSDKNTFLQRINGKSKRKLVVTAACLVAFAVFLKACGKSSPVDSNTVDTSNAIRKRGGESPFFASPPPTPAIVWLMTLPNTGSSFTMTLVARATGFGVATNYGEDVTEERAYSISINPRESNGPYWPGLGSTKSSSNRKLPTTNVLVLTHCLTKLTPHVPTLEEFMQDCVTTFGRTAPDASHVTKHAYSPSKVKKAIHLVRNPLTQIITKFQKEYKNHLHDKRWRHKYPPSKQGFLQWCQDEDDKKLDLDTDYHTAGTVQMMADTTCHHYVAEYILWHNHAFDTVAHLEIPQLIVYHEDLLDAKLETTLDRMLEFIELEKETMPPQRLGETEDVNIEDFLDESQQRQIRRLVEKLATPETWKHVQHYFESVM